MITQNSIQNIIKKALPVIAIIMLIYQLMFTQVLIQDPVAHTVTHLGFALVIVCLSLMLDSQKGWPMYIFLLVCSLFSTIYIMYYLSEILRFRTAIPETSDLLVGALVIVILFIVNYILFGKTFPMVTGVAVIYLIFGRFLPAPFTAPATDYERLLMWLSMEMGTGEGVYGSILNLSAVYLFLFIVFGSLLDGFGGTRFVVGLGQWVGSKIKGGAAVTALFGSSLMGSVTGSTVANISITGAFTIPMMSKGGYAPKQAGAIEAAASNGGQIMPPIMGATAFVISGFAGIPYISIVGAAIIPAAIYYLCVFWYIYLTAQKMDVQPTTETVTVKDLAKDAPLFLVPLGVLIYLLVIGYTLPFVGFWSIVSLIIVGIICSMVRKDFSLNFKYIINTITKGVRSASEIAVICALVGVVATAIKVSGLGIRLPLAIADLSQGILLIALLIAAFASLLLGMGVPTTAAYLLVAVGAVPALREMGVGLMQAHLFCFVFAVFSHITPPIGIGALVASRLAKADYWPVAWEAVKAGFTAFLLPFFIVYTPIVILQPDVEVNIWVYQILAILLIVIAFQNGLSNYFLGYLNLLERLGFVGVGFINLVFVFSANTLFFYIGVVSFLAAAAFHYIRNKKEKSTEDYLSGNSFQ